MNLGNVMTDPHGAADLILRLYEIRREDELRRARDWFAGQFFPATVEDVMAAWTGPESARYRMVTTYWEMAAALVNHGGIPEAMFHDANTEHVAVWVKLRPHLERVRQAARYPSYLSQLERLMTRMPDLEERSVPMLAYMELKRRQLAAALVPTDLPRAPDPAG
jgi:hypothetical protein